MHRLETAHAVVMDLFLVPVARRADHMEYEAIFN
jgi:hypothetical protein